MDLIKYASKLNSRPGEPQGYHLIRNLGIRAFETLGWPTKKQEAWRYSPVQHLSDQFVPINDDQHQQAIDPLAILESLNSPGFHTVLTHNGKMIDCPKELKEKIEILTLKQALEKGLVDSLEFSELNDSLEALNVSFFDRGFYVHIPEKVVIDKPINWIQLSSTAEEKPLFSSRLHIRLGKAARCIFIESHQWHSQTNPLWLNHSTKLHLDEGAQAHFIQWREIAQNQQDTTRLTIKLESDSKLHCLHSSLSRGWSRSDLKINFAGSNAECKIHGIGLSQQKGIVDQQTNLIFDGLNNKSEQICKNLLLDQSRAIFNGKINIRPDAQKTDSSQLHQSLLLSESAEVDTKPELEIYADDVKATHGATVGQLNTDEIFYFQSRGISKERAHSILCFAFLYDLVGQIADSSIQNYLKKRIESYWKGPLI